MCTSLWEKNVQNLVPLHSRAVSYHAAGGHDVTITCAAYYCWFARSYRALKLFCEWNTRYALVARWLCLARRKKKDEIWLIQGTRFLSIIFNLVYIRGVVQHKWRMVHAMVKISHSMEDQHSIQLGFASLNRTIFHLMRNLVPLHDQPLAICILCSSYSVVVYFSSLLLSLIPACTTWRHSPCTILRMTRQRYAVCVILFLHFNFKIVFVYIYLVVL